MCGEYVAKRFYHLMNLNAALYYIFSYTLLSSLNAKRNNHMNNIYGVILQQDNSMSQSAVIARQSFNFLGGGGYFGVFTSSFLNFFWMRPLYLSYLCWITLSMGKKRWFSTVLVRFFFINQYRVNISLRQQMPHADENWRMLI